MLSKEDLAALMTAVPSHAVSVFLPTHAAGREVRQGPIRLKNQVEEAERRLIEAGLRTPEAHEVLAPARALIDDYAFWRHQESGLALFLAPKFFRYHKLPIDVPELVVVGKRFHVKPLLPVFAADGRFFVLAVTAGRVRLFEGSRFGLAELQDADLPESLAALYGETDFVETVHAHPIARPHATSVAAVPKAHNFGGTAKGLRKTQLIEFLSRVARAVEDALSDDQAPLVLAAAPEIEGQFRKLSGSKILLAEGVDINPDAIDEEELHRRAYALVQPLFANAREEAIDRLQSMCGGNDPRSTTEVPEIVQAARFGQVDTLLLAAGERVWGQFDETSNRIAVHDTPEAEDVDLLDYAAVHTLLQGGTVHLPNKAHLPRQGVAAAILRWEQPSA